MSELSALARYDLNLLLSLDALLTERSVTRAAERLHLSQPALSASLARLRTHFDDQILARHGNTYQLTPLALRLAEHTSAALEAARRVFESQTTWDPSESTREFTLYGSDYGFATIGPQITRLAATRAPGVRFRFMLHTPAVVDDVEAALRVADGMLIPHGHIGELPFQDLWKDEWVILADASHPAAQRGLEMEDLGTAHWVFTYNSATAFTGAGRQLRALGIEPHVAAVVESFVALPHYVEGTQRLALVQAGLSGPYLNGTSGVVALKPPFDATPLSNALWWHPLHQRDPEHEWLRALVAEAADEVQRRIDHQMGRA